MDFHFEVILIGLGDDLRFRWRDYEVNLSVDWSGL